MYGVHREQSASRSAHRAHHRPAPPLVPLHLAAHRAQKLRLRCHEGPLDYRKPDGRTIDVALIRRKATGPNARRIGSLVLNFGGPGVSGVSGLPEYLDQYKPLLDRYDLVSFDPRGVGATIPVRCGKTADDSGYDGADACAEHSGADLPYIGTSHTARDLDLMRHLLGDERLHYFGVSYGTALGAVYAHLYPSHVGRLVLEASVDPTEDLNEEQLSQVKAVQAAFDAPAGGGRNLDADDLAYTVSDCLDLGTDSWSPLAKAQRVLGPHRRRHVRLPAVRPRPDATIG
ncbi:alpha/beta fold hydrolase [Streptomyces sp. SAI-129]|uniref:alpha/beta fold hydrolase n=1 Tax=Streptomyces sp. SAI-129 TaxID=3377727 RepID=UPI003C7B70B0